MRIRTLLLVALSVSLLLTFLLITAVLVVRDKLDQLTDAQNRVQLVVREVSSLLLLTNEYALHAEERAAIQWRSHHKNIVQTLEGEKTTVVAESSKALKQALGLVRFFDQIVISRNNTESELQQRRTRLLFDQLLTHTQLLFDMVYRWGEATTTNREALAYRFHLLSISVPFVMLFILVVLVMFLVRRVLLPLSSLQQSVMAIARGNIAVRCETSVDDEIGDVSRTFDEMAIDLVGQLRDSEERFKSLSEASFNGVIIHDKGRILECNNRLSHITGYSYQEHIGMNGLELIADEYLDTVIANIERGYDQAYEVKGVRKNGSQYPLAIHGQNILYKGTNARVIEFLDITERKQAEEKLQLAASVFTHAREGIFITDAQGCIVDVNDTFTHITGYCREEALGQSARFLHSSRNTPEFYNAMWQTLTEKGHWDGEIWNQRKNGETYAEMCTISAVLDADAKVVNYVALFTDITLMKEHQQQLEHIAHYDILTNLPNRALLYDRLKQGLVQSQRRGKLLAVAFLDLDGFKPVNDTYGHDFGDELLITIADRLNGALREGDTLARIGGDEFVAVLTDLEDADDCQPVLDRMLKSAAKSVTVDDVLLNVSASIGVSLYPNDGTEAEQLLRQADQAMYIAKKTGKNRYKMFDVEYEEAIKTQYASQEN